MKPQGWQEHCPRSGPGGLQDERCESDGEARGGRVDSVVRMNRCRLEEMSKSVRTGCRGERKAESRAIRTQESAARALR